MNTDNDGWSLVGSSDSRGGDDSSSAWTVVSNDCSSSNGSSGTNHLQQTRPVTTSCCERSRPPGTRQRQRLPEERDCGEDFFQQEDWIDDYTARKARGNRTGKRALKHSVVQRRDYRFGRGGSSNNEGWVDVPRQQGRYGRHTRPPQPTCMDQCLPELHHICSPWGIVQATVGLGHGKRWETVPAFLEQLERQGLAQFVRVPRGHRYDPNRLWYRDVLVETVSYNVKVTAGGGNNSDKEEKDGFVVYWVHQPRKLHNDGDEKSGAWHRYKRKQGWEHPMNSGCGQKWFKKDWLRDKVRRRADKAWAQQTAKSFNKKGC